MRTLLIRISEQPDGWPISLHLDDGSDDWPSRPVAQDVLPVALPAPPLADPAAGAEGIRAFLLEEANESTRFEELGEYLLSLLRHGAIGDAWRRIADDPAARGGAGARLLLDVPTAISALPWELMCQRANRFAADVSAPLARVGPGFPGPGDLRRVRWPLRVLVVVGSQEHDRIVAAEEELTNLNDAFRRMCGQVDVEFLPQPSRKEVRDAYTTLRPHIFHFIGHGDVQDGSGTLILHDPDSHDDLPWTLGEIKADFRGWQPSLAILNACRSSEVTGQEGAWGVADAFAELGVPAVIAMQADIRGDAAAAFTGELYRALVDHDALDVAVTRGRRAISDITGFERRDFALPTLTVTFPPASVLRMCFGVSEEHRRRVEVLHRTFPAFVDRTKERRRLWRDVDPEPDEPDPAVDPSDATAIVGAARVGKSELARWCVGACELHGGNAAYVNLARGRRVEYLAALELIAESLSSSTVHGDRNRTAFAQWTRSAQRPVWDSGGAAEPPPPDDALGNTFVFFGDALRDAADKQPLLLVLDDIGALPEADLALLSEYLLEPIANHKLEPVRVILVLSEEQRNRLPERLRNAMGNPIVLTSFKPDEFKYIAGQYLRYHFTVTSKVLDEKLKALNPTESFNWELMDSLPRVAESWGWSRF